MDFLLVLRTILAFFTLLLPGFAFWVWFHNNDNDPGQDLAQILGVSFSAIALGALIFYVLKIQVTGWILGGFLTVCLGLSIFGWIKKKPKFVWWHWAIMLGILGCLIFWRFWQARDLVLPNWVDSQHHVLIVRKFIEGGGLPRSLEPYLPGPFYYHFSFHSVVAWFASISGQNAEQPTLMLGQVLNALIGLGIYALTKAITKDWRPALIAAIFVTFVTKMPGYYLTWGRYTLLTGTYLLALAMAFAQKIHEGERGAGNVMTLGLLTTGALLSHYLIAFLLAFFLIILGLDWIIRSIKAKKWDFKGLFALLIPALSGLALSLPWYMHVLKHSTGRYNVGVSAGRSHFLPKPEDWNYIKYVLGPTAAYVLIALALIGLVIAFIKSEYRRIASWSLILMLFTVPTGIEFMGFRGDYFALVTFIPISILSAIFLFWIAELLQKWRPKKQYANLFLILVSITMLLLGIDQNKKAINRTTVIAVQDDVEALDWINENLPEDARFYVNTVYWGYGVSRGLDGGGWILPYTGRFSNAPTTFFPYGLDSETNAVWMSWGNRANTITECNEAFYSLLADADLRYIYVRDGVRPNNQENVAGIQSQTLLNCPGITQLYQNNSVSIWKLD